MITPRNLKWNLSSLSLIVVAMLLTPGCVRKKAANLRTSGQQPTTTEEIVKVPVEEPARNSEEKNPEPIVPESTVPWDGKTLIGTERFQLIPTE